MALEYVKGEFFRGRRSRKYSAYVRFAYRYYTKYFGTNKDAGANMCHYAVTHYDEWEEAIEKWQNPILNDEYVL